MLSNEIHFHASFPKKKLAKQVKGARSWFELRKMWLTSGQLEFKCYLFHIKQEKCISHNYLCKQDIFYCKYIFALNAKKKQTEE